MGGGTPPTENRFPREAEHSAPSYPADTYQEEEGYEPIILSPDQLRKYDESEVVEENLSLEDNERELITKALQKHQGHRREAAQDLGISERTLYRKIEKYGL